MSDLVTINAELFDDTYHIEHTPVGYIVYSDDMEGEPISAPYDKKETAQTWLAGWQAAMEFIEGRIG